MKTTLTAAMILLSVFCFGQSKKYTTGLTALGKISTPSKSIARAPICGYARISMKNYSVIKPDTIRCWLKEISIELSMINGGEVISAPIERWVVGYMLFYYDSHPLRFGIEDSSLPYTFLYSNKTVVKNKVTQFIIPEK